MKYKLIEQVNPHYTVMQQILHNRGIKDEDMLRYIKTSQDDVYPYQLFGQDIQDAVHMLSRALNSEGKIYIQVDSDCDGYTSSAVLINYLHKMGYRDKIMYSFHPSKEHGFDIDRFVENKLQNYVNLVIIPDAGSNEYDKHAKLRDMGIPMLILDHHHAEKKTEDAVIVNNQLSDYPNKELSGVGVTYKFCKALDEWFGQDYADEFLDLVAVGMVADMMSLKEMETKFLINEGLLNIKNQFLKALFNKQAYQLRDGITPFGVGFYIAPVINAVIRTGTIEEKNVMFSAMLDWNANKEVPSTKRGHKKGELELLYNQAVRLATNLQRKQKDLRDSAMGAVIEKIETQELHKNKILLVDITDLEIPKTLTGLIANQIMAKYQQPVLLLRHTDKGLLEGSGRGYEKSELKDTREFLQNSGVVEYAEGHGSAFGCGIAEDKISEFFSTTNDLLKDMTFEPVYLVDFVWSADEITPQKILDIAAGKNFWGKDMDEPVIVMQNVTVKPENISLMSPDKNPTLKMQVNGITLIKFKSSIEEYEMLKNQGVRVTLDILGKCKENEWQGQVEAQVIIQDYEIKTAMKWVF